MYLALARKYRPQKFKDLIGQPHITKTLQNAISMDKLYPALIFSGMKGIGKTSAARILAKALNCEKGPAVEPCNECFICTEITEDKSLDYLEIDGASNNGVEEVRNLREKIKYNPLKNRYRIIVIDEVHMLSNSAWNALLKTVEEPPEHTYFILATTDFHKIPATIVSRCQHFEFKRISSEVIEKVLKEICSLEAIKISDYSLYLIARSAEGSLRDAKKILDQAIAISEGDVKDDDVVEILGIIDEEIFINLTEEMFSQQRKEIIERINSLIERGIDLRFFYGEYIKFFRDLLILKSVNEPEKLHNLNPENISRLKIILKDLREVELLRYFNAIKDLEITIRNTENPRIILEYLFIKLSYFPSLKSIEEVIGNLGSNKAAAAVTETVSGHKKPAASQKPVSLPRPDRPEAQIQSLLTHNFEKSNPRLSSALRSADFSVKGSELFIQLPSDAQFALKTVKESITAMQEQIKNSLKQNLEIKINITESDDSESVAEKIKGIKEDQKISNFSSKIKGRIISVENLKGGNNG